MSLEQGSEHYHRPGSAQWSGRFVIVLDRTRSVTIDYIVEPTPAHRSHHPYVAHVRCYTPSVGDLVIEPDEPLPVLMIHPKKFDVYIKSNGKGKALRKIKRAAYTYLRCNP